MTLERTSDNEYLVFEGWSAFRKTLTPERLKILQVLAEEGAKSVHDLSNTLKRDAQDVARDIEILEMLGLVERWTKN